MDLTAVNNGSQCTSYRYRIENDENRYVETYDVTKRTPRSDREEAIHPTRNCWMYYQDFGIGQWPLGPIPSHQVLMTSPISEKKKRTTNWFHSYVKYVQLDTRMVLFQQQNFTFEIWTPRFLWAPEHSMQTRIPRFRDAHSGLGAWHSAHFSFPGIPLMMLVTLLYASSTTDESESFPMVTVPSPISEPPDEIWLVADRAIVSEFVSLNVTSFVYALVSL